MNIALLAHHDRGHSIDGVRALAAALHNRGHEAQVLAANPRWARVADATLSKRGFVVPLAHVPSSVARMLLASYDLVHAFSIPDAAAALAWRRLSGRPTVFTATRPLDRAGLADRRLVLRTLGAALEDSSAVTATSHEAQAALWRWLAVQAPVVPLGDAEAHERLYRALLAAAPSGETPGPE